MKLDEILSAAGKGKRRRRVGRGHGSGHGKTSGRGHKGYGARSGAKKRLGYEGGQTPQISRIPKRGFNNANFRADVQIVNIADLDEIFDAGATIDAAALAAAGLIDDPQGLVKILGDGETEKAFAVHAARFTASAREKIIAAGGTVEQVEPRPKFLPRHAQQSRRAKPKAETPEAKPQAEAKSTKPAKPSDEKQGSQEDAESAPAAEAKEQKEE
jgi:large subunit ribosomal protein L15